MKYRIYRHPEGIGLNGKEFVLDNKGEYMLFDTIDKAVKLIADDLGKDVSRIELEDNYGIHIEENVDDRNK